MEIRSTGLIGLQLIKHEKAHQSCAPAQAGSVFHREAFLVLSFLEVL